MPGNNRIVARPDADYIPVIDFKIVTFFDATQQRQIVILYSLAQDGIVREFVGGQWKAFPVQKSYANPSMD